MEVSPFLHSDQRREMVASIKIPDFLDGSDLKLQSSIKKAHFMDDSATTRQKCHDCIIKSAVKSSNKRGAHHLIWAIRKSGVFADGKGGLYGKSCLRTAGGMQHFSPGERIIRRTHFTLYHKICKTKIGRLYLRDTDHLVSSRLTN